VEVVLVLLRSSSFEPQGQDSSALAEWGGLGRRMEDWLLLNGEKGVLGAAGTKGEMMILEGRRWGEDEVDKTVQVVDAEGSEIIGGAMMVSLLGIWTWQEG
jgi:hypothetical protein